MSHIISSQPQTTQLSPPRRRWWRSNPRVLAASLLATTVLLTGGSTLVLAQTGGSGDAVRNSLMAQLRAEAGGATFSAERGAAFYSARQSGGKPDTPSCTACHGTSPRDTGQTRAGKPIEPLAVSITPTRFTDLEKVDTWFGRNCTSVLGRACTAQEKGDFLAFVFSQ